MTDGVVQQPSGWDTATPEQIITDIQDARRRIKETRRVLRECVCGASYYRGCFCHLTLREFLNSPNKKGV